VSSAGSVQHPCRIFVTASLILRFCQNTRYQMAVTCAYFDGIEAKGNTV
jgi:hypothetical protein